MFSPVIAGQTLSHYRIISTLGGGGMGVVYEAEDLKLHRRVALKFLPPDLASDHAAIHRLEREAQAASALDHPNICTIYDIDDAGGELFIVMEFLDGKTLKDIIGGNPIEIEWLLDIGIQIADALDAAHAAGILHRDIKPSNLFITRRGQVKMLDFGLVKRTAAHATAASDDTATTLTALGDAAGTLVYMSPEQVLGKELDARTDLFSFGTVLYEMATGMQPFRGSTPGAVAHSILSESPILPVRLNPAVPPKLEEIIAKALEKKRELRYQNASEIRIDLQRLKRDLDLTGNVATPPIVADAPKTLPRVPQAISISAVSTAAKHHKWAAGIVSLMAILLAAAAGYGIYGLLSRTRPVPFQNFSVNKITDNSDAVLVAISPDGKYILDVEEENGEQSVWLRAIPAAAAWKRGLANSNMQILSPGPFRYRDIRFSPDGNSAYFVRSAIGEANSSLYRVPALGGTPEKVVAVVDTVCTTQGTACPTRNISFTPDGRSFAYSLSNSPVVGQFRLVIHSIETGVENVLVSGPMSEYLDDPAWSPGGNEIACTIRQPGNTRRGLSGLMIVNAVTGSKKLLLGAAGYVSKPVWLPDGSGLLFLLRDKETNFVRNRIAEISYPSGTLRSVTHDINTYSHLSLSADAKTLAAVLSQSRYQLYVAPASDLNAKAEQITSVVDPHVGFSWTPDGQIVFVDQALSLNMLSLQSPAPPPTLLSQDVLAFSPSACANGRYIVFTVGGQREKNPNTATIWRMDSGGGNMKQLSDGTLDQRAVCSPDGQWVYYIDTSNGKKMRRVPLEGGDSQLVIDRLVISALDVSPDGKFVVFATPTIHDGSKLALALVPVSSPQQTRVITPQRPIDGNPRFTRDGKAVVFPFHDKDADNLWLQSLDGSPGKQITDFKSELIGDFYWSFDGTRLAIIRGHTDSDVVLISSTEK